jgi:hypothetical protein
MRISMVWKTWSLAVWKRLGTITAAVTVAVNKLPNILCCIERSCLEHLRLARTKAKTRSMLLQQVSVVR